MSLLLIAAGVFAVLFLLGLVLALALGRAASDGDEQVREAFRRQRQEREARSKLYGNGG
jgi:Flp pilus assembly protein TadB